MSGNLIDPLKMHTQGVKKPLEDKGEKLNALANNNQRYYPTDARGGLDEWGAVIKRQGEAYQREKETIASQKVNQARSYGMELQQAMQQKQKESDL